MSRTQENFVTWKCDHCGRKKKGTNNYPKGWRHLMIAVAIEDSMIRDTPGKRHPAASFEGDACRGCSKQLRLAAMRMKKAWRAP